MRSIGQAVVIAAALALAANVGFLGGQLLAQPDADATQAQSAQTATDRAMLRELRGVARELRGLGRAVGTPILGESLIDVSRDNEKNLRTMCRQVTNAPDELCSEFN